MNKTTSPKLMKLFKLKVLQRYARNKFIVFLILYV